MKQIISILMIVMLCSVVNAGFANVRNVENFNSDALEPSLNPIQRNCEVTDRYRSDFKDGINESGQVVRVLGSQCADYAQMVVCSKPSYAPENDCRAVFASPVKGAIDLDDCNGEYCYKKGWFDDAVKGKYIGYNCMVCEDTPVDVGVKQTEQARNRIMIIWQNFRSSLERAFVNIRERFGR